ncbi:MAG: hypothetical protein ACYCYO_01920 [Bacilli bacterium]
MKPSVGRIVHFVLKDRSGELVHRPAIIVRNWADEGVYVQEEGVQLQVFTDGTNDGPEYASGIHWATSVHHDEAADTEHTWHWPERVNE